MDNLNLLKNIDLYKDKRSLPEGMFLSCLTAGRDPLKDPVFGAKEAGLVFNSAEQKHIWNAVSDYGVVAEITTLTQIRQKVVEQKFFTQAPSEVMPVSVGEGAFMQELLTYREFATGDDFESGFISSGSGVLKKVDTLVEPVKTPIRNWAKEIEYTLFDIEQAAKSGNWGLIEAKERSRKKNWDLGTQHIAFLGAESDSRVTGLLNSPEVDSELTIITSYIKDMSDANFQVFLGKLIDAFLTNNNYTEQPDTFMIPMIDYVGLAKSVSAAFPVGISRLEAMKKAFSEAIGGKPFNIVGSPYSDQRYNNLSKNRYCLYKNSPDTLTFFVPVNYTSIIAGSLNNFSFQSVGYGQVGSVQVFRPQEVLYFDFANGE